jgi:outer membrane biosynthesis protein TonB
MKLRSGKRIGQSGSELSLAIVYSFFLHVLVALAAVFLYIKAAPKIYVPPFYEVMLVKQPVELPEAPPPKEVAPLPPKKEPAPKKEMTAPEVVKVIPKKETRPDLPEPKKEPTTAPEKPLEKVKEQPQTPSAGVTVTTPQMDEKFSWYLVRLRGIIERNWKPTPDAKDAKARILFTVNRSGWVTVVNLDAEHSQGTFAFQQAAIRAINLSNPFPAMPDDLPKQSLDFTVDLVPKQ